MTIQSRKLQENGWEPRWFGREGPDGPFRFVGGYWEAREEGKWDGCPNIFGEFDELLAGSESSFRYKLLYTKHKCNGIRIIGKKYLVVFTFCKS